MFYLFHIQHTIAVLIQMILFIPVDSIVKRDCYDSLAPSEVQACELGTNIKCHHCNETLCNEGHPKHKCIKCDSNSDANCMTNATQFDLEQCIYDSNDLDDFYCFTKYVSCFAC